MTSLASQIAYFGNDLACYRKRSTPIVKDTSALRVLPADDQYTRSNCGLEMRCQPADEPRVVEVRLEMEAKHDKLFMLRFVARD